MCIRDRIELNIEDLELNSAKSVADLELDLEDVDIITDPSLNIVSITPPASEEEVVEDVQEEETLDEGGEPAVEASKNEEENSSDDNSGESENS